MFRPTRANWREKCHSVAHRPSFTSQPCRNPAKKLRMRRWDEPAQRPRSLPRVGRGAGEPAGRRLAHSRTGTGGAAGEPSRGWRPARPARELRWPWRVPLYWRSCSPHTPKPSRPSSSTNGPGGRSSPNGRRRHGTALAGSCPPAPRDVYVRRLALKLLGLPGVARRLADVMIGRPIPPIDQIAGTAIRHGTRMP